ncbi:transcription antitermination factor NusB [Candidatus Microgenomates bacterium]|nr:transcription antitermination factor NusB [Candidatus Microgenomates bacterium]
MPYLSIRHQSRIIVLQSLYEWDFDETKNPLDILNRNVNTSGYKVDDEFCQKLLSGVTDKMKDIDELIKKTAPEWPLEQVAVIDRSVLRIGIFELLFDNEVPPKAVINEAVELGKSFGGENSGKFVNGVLGTIYRNSAKYAEEEMVTSSGGIVYRLDENKTIYFLAIKNIYNKWTFPKGKVEEGETWQEAAIREVKEETGIESVDIQGEIGDIKFTDKSDTEPIKKTVHFFLMRTEQRETKKNDVKEHINDVAWMTEEKLRQNLDYPNLVELLDKAKEMME